MRYDKMGNVTEIVGPEGRRPRHTRRRFGLPPWPHPTTRQEMTRYIQAQSALRVLPMHRRADCACILKRPSDAQPQNEILCSKGLGGVALNKQFVANG